MATKFKKFLKSFTLIELIIVIAIIAVLGASAFLLLSQWMSKGRDSRRITDLRTLEKTIQISFIDKEGANYPDPDPKVGVTIGTGFDSYGVLWYQGKFGEKMTSFVGNLNKIPKDPKGNYYDYSLTEDKKYYQLLAIMENDKKVSFGLGKVYGDELERTYILTNYEGYIIKKTVDNKYILIKTETIMVDPTILDGYSQEEYEMDINNDLLKADAPYSERVEVLTGDISGLLSEDPTEKQAAMNTIQTLFPELNNTPIVEEIIQQVGASSNIQVNNTNQCTAHEYSGYNFDIIPHGEAQTKTRTESITDGTKTFELIATCNNGVLTYSQEQSSIECANDKVLSNGSCVADICQGNMPDNAQLNGTQGVSGTWGYSETAGLCKFKCILGYNYQGGMCVENNCSADTKTIDGHIFSVGAMNHGVKQTITSTTETIDNGTITYSQEFECDKGQIIQVGLLGANEPVCEVGHSPSGTSCTINTYTVSGSFGANANGATINVCGSNVTAASDGTFTAIRNHGSVCNNITATRSGYVCSTTTQGPLSLSVNVTNISGNCNEIVNGTCGTANGVATTTAPTTNLCSAGNASVVTTNATTFTWNCNGINTGTNASCTAPKAYCNATTPSGVGVNTTTVGIPTSANQSWVIGASNCGYTCKENYSGTNCATYTSPYIGTAGGIATTTPTAGLGCTGNDIVIRFGDNTGLTMAGCNSNVGTSSYNQCTNNATHCQGKYYTWANASSACPSPRRLPTYSEFNNIVTKLVWKNNSPNNPPFYMRSTGYNGGIDSSGRGGYRSSTPDGSNKYGLLVVETNVSVPIWGYSFVSWNSGSYSYTVRCVKN